MNEKRSRRSCRSTRTKKKANNFRPFHSSISDQYKEIQTHNFTFRSKHTHFTSKRIQSILRNKTLSHSLSFLLLNDNRLHTTTPLRYQYQNHNNKPLNWVFHFSKGTKQLLNNSIYLHISIKYIMNKNKKKQHKATNQSKPS